MHHRFIRRLALASAAWMAWLGIALASATAAPPPAEVFFKRPQWRADMQLSPDGSKLAFSSAAAGGRMALFVLDLGPGAAVQAVAAYADADIRQFEWAGNDRLLYSLIDLQAGSGADKSTAPGLFTIKLGERRPRMLVKRFGRRFVVSGYQDPDEANALGWNHQLLHVPSTAPEQGPVRVVLGELFGDQDDGLTEMRLHWLYPASGDTESIKVQAPSGAVRWWFDSKGEPRVVLTQRKDRQALRWRGPGRTEWQLLAEATVDRLPFWPSMVTDQGELYVEHRHGDAGEAVVSPFDFERMAPRTKPLIAVPGFDVDGAALREEGTGALAGYRLDADAETTVWFSTGHKALQAIADAKLPGRVNRISCRRCGADDSLMLVHSWSDRNPGELLLYRHADKRWQRLMTVQPGVDPKAMGTVDLHRIKARDGRDIPVWITLPPGHQAGQKHPTIVMVHGGPWVRTGRWAWDPMNQFLASRGYLVIEPEYRGSDGYGLQHLVGGFKQYGQAMQDDVADALIWARQAGIADAERACIAGASYGGYASLMGLARHPQLYRCGAAWVALTDLMLYVKGSFWVDDDISNSARRYSLFDRVGNPEVEAERAMLVANSPIHLADRIQAPVLLAFGEDDTRVPMAHGQRMREALRQAGRPPLWITYPGEGHGWREEKTRIDFAKRLEAFLAQHLGRP